MALPPPPTSDPRYDPNMMSTADTSDQLSPTSLIMNYMKSKGVPLNAGNISQALRDVGNGVIDIPGLRAGQASTDAEDKAAMAATRGRGGSGSGGGGNTSAPPMADLTQGPTNEANWQPNAGNTSAPPSAIINAPPATSTTVDQMQRTGPDSLASFLTPAAIASAVIGAGAIPGMMNRGGEYVGNAQMPSGRMTDVGNLALSAPEDLAAVAPPAPGSLEAAMLKATGGSPSATALSPPPRQITGPPSAAEAPVAAPGSVVTTPPPPSPVAGVKPIGPPGAADMVPPRGATQPVIPNFLRRPPSRIPPGLGTVLEGLRGVR